VFTAKKFPGMEESIPLSCAFADQGIKIKWIIHIALLELISEILIPISYHIMHNSRQCDFFLHPFCQTDSCISIGSMHQYNPIDH
jgi:hypothetical protein